MNVAFIVNSVKKSVAAECLILCLAVATLDSIKILFSFSFFCAFPPPPHIYMYIYTHTHVHIYLHIYTYTYVHTHIHIYIQIYIHMYILIYIYTHTHKYIYVDTCMSTHALCHAPVRTNASLRIAPHLQAHFPVGKTASPPSITLLCLNSCDQTLPSSFHLLRDFLLVCVTLHVCTCPTALVCF